MQNCWPHVQVITRQYFVLWTVRLHFGHKLSLPFPNSAVNRSYSSFSFLLNSAQLWPSLTFTWHAKQHFVLHSLFTQTPTVKFSFGNNKYVSHAGQLLNRLDSSFWIYSLVHFSFCSFVMRSWSIFPANFFPHPFGHSIVVLRLTS